VVHGQSYRGFERLEPVGFRDLERTPDLRIRIVPDHLAALGNRHGVEKTQSLVRVEIGYQEFLAQPAARRVGEYRGLPYHPLAAGREVNAEEFEMRARHYSPVPQPLILRDIEVNRYDETDCEHEHRRHRKNFPFQQVGAESLPRQPRQESFPRRRLVSLFHPPDHFVESRYERPLDRRDFALHSGERLEFRLNGAERLKLVTAHFAFLDMVQKSLGRGFALSKKNFADYPDTVTFHNSLSKTMPR